MASGTIKSNLLVEDKDWTYVPITNESGSGAYYCQNGYDISKSGYKPISATIISWDSMIASVTPYIASDSVLKFISDVSQTPDRIITRIVYIKI